MMSHVHINVSGTKFEFSQYILDDRPSGRLVRMYNEAKYKGEPLSFFVDRMPECFSAILTYYQTGELHIPLSVCAGYFLRELEFWEISVNEMAECCHFRMQTHFENKAVRQTFRSEIKKSYKMRTEFPASTSLLKKRLWATVDFQEKTVISTLYFLIVFLMLLTSIVTIALSTDVNFRRSLKKCELLEFAEYTDDDLYSTALSVFNNVECEDNPILVFAPERKDKAEEKLLKKDYFDDWYYDMDKKEAFKMEDNETSENQTIDQHENNTIEQIHLPYRTVRLFALEVLELVTIAFFTVDFILRIVSCPSRLRYFYSFTNLFDFIALSGSFLNITIISIERQYRYGIGWIKVFRYLQVFRSFRFFRVFDHVRASKVLAYSLRKHCRDFALIILLLLFGVTLFSTVLFFVEGRKVALSIPQLWYWAVVTMTTVGYGDVVPSTNLGKFVASLCSISGVLVLAVALPVFVNNFIVLYQYSCIDSTWKMYLRKSSTAGKSSKSVQNKRHSSSDSSREGMLSNTRSSVVTFNNLS